MKNFFAKSIRSMDLAKFFSSDRVTCCYKRFGSCQTSSSPTHQDFSPSSINSYGMHSTSTTKVAWSSCKSVLLCFTDSSWLTWVFFDAQLNHHSGYQRQGANKEKLCNACGKFLLLCFSVFFLSLQMQQSYFYWHFYSAALSRDLKALSHESFMSLSQNLFSMEPKPPKQVSLPPIQISAIPPSTSSCVVNTKAQESDWWPDWYP